MSRRYSSRLTRKSAAVGLARSSATRAATSSTRSAGCGWVESQFGDASPIARLLDPRQRGQQVRHTGRIPTRLGGVLRTEAIRLQFVIATVPQEQHAEPGLRETPKGLRARREDAADK